MNRLNELLDGIEEALDKVPVTLMDKLTHGAKKMYTYHALGICLAKLTNNSTEDGKNGILRTKTIFDRIEKLKMKGIDDQM